MRLNNEFKLFIEIIKWLVITILLVFSIILNYYYINLSFMLRTIAIIFFMIISCLIALMTNIVKYTIVFVREARTEISKVIWPDRKETLNTTLIVVVVTTIMSITLWVLDSIMVYIVSCITSLRL